MMTGMKMSRRNGQLLAAVLSFGAVVVLPNTAFACMTFSVPNVVTGTSYDPFSAAASTTGYQITSVNGCSGGVMVSQQFEVIYLDPASPGGLVMVGPNGASLHYDIQTSNGQSMLNETGVVDGANEWRARNLNRATISANTFNPTVFVHNLVIAPNQIVPPGQYTVNITDSNGRGMRWSPTYTYVYNTNSNIFGGNTWYTKNLINFTVTVAPSLNLALGGCDLPTTGTAPSHTPTSVPTGTSCTLGLGTPAVGMTNGDSRRARVNTRANIPHQISMSSQNGGRLKLEGDTTNTWYVPYTASMITPQGTSSFACAGIGTNEVCGATAAIPASTTTLGTDVFFDVQVNDPNVTRKRAGTYRDTITLTVSAS
jgi:hypothetical protein